jgi:hypothetical protein
VPTAKAKPSIYQLKITLLDIEPPIWRCIQVPSTLFLSSLHDAIQAVTGWTDSHLHQFEKDRRYWGVPDVDRFEDDIEIIDESKVRSEMYCWPKGTRWSTSTILGIIGGIRLSWRRSCHQTSLQSLSALMGRGVVHRKMLVGRKDIKNFWRSFSNQGMRNLSITGSGQETRSMQKNSKWLR